MSEWQPKSDIEEKLRDLFDDAVSAALSTIAKSINWQPMATAPEENGICVLAYPIDGEVSIARFITDAWFDIGGNVLEGDDLPTHWMSLPPAPTSPATASLTLRSGST